MLKLKAADAAFWSALDVFFSQGLGFCVSIILARLLVPEDFGIFAILAFFISIAGLFVNAGFTSALVQKQHISLIDESTVFWFNLFVGLIMTVALCTSAGAISGLFEVPILKPLALLLAVNVMFAALSSVQNARLMKHLDFKTLAVINLTRTTISGSVGIALAWQGYGVWALAAQSLLSNFLGMILLWWISPWRPALAFSTASFKQLFSFGGYVFVEGLFDQMYQRSYIILIGKYFGVREVGLYHRAANTQDIIKTLLTRSLSRVAFPVLATVNEDMARLQAGGSMAIRTIMFFVCPALLCLFTMSEIFILAIFGEKWLGTVPILQVLCGVGLIFPMVKINQTLLHAQGHARTNFYLGVTKSLSGITLLIIGSRWGIIGIAYSQVVNSLFSLWLHTHFSQKFIAYGLFKQLADSFSSVVLGSLAALAALHASQSFASGPIPGLLAGTLAGGIFYLLSNYLLKVRIFNELLDMLKLKLDSR
jgi:O-antigen/teichoic acid export membrane protein